MRLDISCSPCKSYKHISFLQFLLLVILYHLFTKNSIPYIKQRRIRLFYHKHILWSRNLKWTKQVRFFIFIQADLRLGMESMRLRIVWNFGLTRIALLLVGLIPYRLCEFHSTQILIPYNGTPLILY